MITAYFLDYFLTPSFRTQALYWEGHYLIFHCYILSNWSNVSVISDQQIFVKCPKNLLKTGCEQCTITLNGNMWENPRINKIGENLMI